MTSKTKRIIFASLAPTALQLVIAAAITLYCRDQPSGDQSLGFIIVLLLSVSLSAIILGQISFDRFWKVHLYSCFTTVLPWLLMIVGTASLKSTHGYFWLGVTLLTFLVIVATVISLPITYLIYAYTRALNADN